MQTADGREPEEAEGLRGYLGVRAKVDPVVYREVHPYVQIKDSEELLVRTAHPPAMEQKARQDQSVSGLVPTDQLP